MSCSSCNSCYQKSCVQEYSDTSLVINPSTDGGIKATFGNICTDTGISICPQLNGVKIQKGGLFEFAFDAVVSSSAVGTIMVQLYKDGSPLPCALDEETFTTATAAFKGLHFSTRLQIGVCEMTKPIFTVIFTSSDLTTLTVLHVSLGVTKLA